MQTCRHFIKKPYFKPLFCVCNVCKCNFLTSAFILACRHADIKVYTFTNVTTMQKIKLYFITNYNNIRYKLHFLQYSKNFVRNS